MKRKRTSRMRRRAPRKRTVRRGRKPGTRALRKAGRGRRRIVRRSRRRRSAPAEHEALPVRYEPYATLASLPEGLRASAIVSVRDEEHAVDSVVRELKRLPLHEIIVVVNGSTDGSLAAALSHPDVTVVHYADPLGYDVGRAIGAKLATTDILLFVDGDFALPAERLAPFLAAIHNGADVALNDVMPLLGPFRRWDDVSRVKAFLNLCLGRPELGANSMTAVPHAISRRALATVGAAALMVPPKAQAAAIRRGLKVTVAASVDVITGNRLRQGNTGRGNNVAGLIIGDHIEALREAARGAGPRLALKDDLRRRAAAGGDGP